jgi:hypothetical protein
VSTVRDALRWNPQAKRKAGRPGNTLRRTILIEARGKVGADMTYGEWQITESDGGPLYRLYAPSGVTVPMMMIMISQKAVIF